MYLIKKFIKNASKNAVYLFSLIGLVMGIAILFSTLCIAASGKAVVQRSIGSNALNAYSVTFDNGMNGFNEEDTKLLKQGISEIVNTFCIAETSGSIEINKKTRNMDIKWIDKQYQIISNMQLLKGRFITADDISKKNKVVLIDDYSALKIYGTRDIIGQSVKLKDGGETLTVRIIGVIKNIEVNDKKDLFKEDHAGTCLAPITVIKDLNRQYLLSKIIILAPKHFYTEELRAGVLHLFERKYRDALPLKIDKYEQIDAVEILINNNKGIISSTIILLILFGGIGILYRMLHYVQNKKTEIALSLITGTPKKELIWDILYRTVLVSLYCCFAGVTIGLILSAIMSHFINIGIHITLTPIAAAMFLSTLTGLCAGLFPAVQAGKTAYVETFWT